MAKIIIGERPKANGLFVSKLFLRQVLPTLYLLFILPSTLF